MIYATLRHTLGVRPTFPQADKHVLDEHARIVEVFTQMAHSSGKWCGSSSRLPKVFEQGNYQDARNTTLNRRTGCCVGLTSFNNSAPSKGLSTVWFLRLSSMWRSD
jgi:hypothetical protein